MRFASKLLNLLSIKRKSGKVFVTFLILVVIASLGYFLFVFKPSHKQAALVAKEIEDKLSSEEEPYLPFEKIDNSEGIDCDFVNHASDAEVEDKLARFLFETKLFQAKLADFPENRPPIMATDIIIKRGDPCAVRLSVFEDFPDHLSRIGEYRLTKDHVKFVTPADEDDTD